MSRPTETASGYAGRPTALLGEDPFDDRSLGGKGRSLAELVDARYPVPPTGVVTTAAYRVVAADPAVIRLTDSITAGGEHGAEQVDEVFLGAEVPPELEERIVELAGRVGGTGQLAVRSSATVEDLEGSSFAGQYRSLLDVEATDPAAVMRAVRLVWASLWHPAPVAYRRAFDIDESNVAMAVVMMQMIPATTAGVVFTTDPGGADEAARVEAVEGLGEQLVSGQRTPSAWVVPRNDAAGRAPASSRGTTQALGVRCPDTSCSPRPSTASTLAASSAPPGSVVNTTPAVVAGIICIMTTAIATLDSSMSKARR